MKDFQALIIGQFEEVEILEFAKEVIFFGKDGFIENL